MMKRLLQFTRRPDITFCRSGKIRISAGIVKTLDISPGDSINIMIINGEFLLYKISHSLGRHVAACYPSKSGSRNFCANSTDMCRSFLDAVGVAPHSFKASFMIGEPLSLDSQTFCPIITRPLSVK